MTTAPNPYRCEPPEELRGRVGWHWLGHRSGGEWLLQWHASPWEEWLFDRRGYSPAILAHKGYHYIGPVTLHSEVQRLREENDRLRDALRGYASDYDHHRGCSAWDGGAKARATLFPPEAPASVTEFPNILQEMKPIIPGFKDWLIDKECEILLPTNPWEVFRFRHPDGVGIIYTNSNDELTFVGTAKTVLESYLGDNR